MGVVDDAVEDGVGQRRIADDLVPAVDRQLAGDDQRAGVVAILDDLQQIALLFGEQRFRAPSRRGSADRPGRADASAWRIGRRRGPAPARQTAAARADRAPRGSPGRPCSRARKPATTCRRRRAGQETVAMLADPVAAGQLQEHARDRGRAASGSRHPRPRPSGAAWRSWRGSRSASAGATCFSCSSRMPSHSAWLERAGSPGWPPGRGSPWPCRAGRARAAGRAWDACSKVGLLSGSSGSRGCWRAGAARRPRLAATPSVEPVFEDRGDARRRSARRSRPRGWLTASARAASMPRNSRRMPRQVRNPCSGCGRRASTAMISASVFGPIAARLALQALRRPLGVAPVRARHVLGLGAVARAAIAPGMGGDALAAVEHLDRARRWRGCRPARGSGRAAPSRRSPATST